MPEPEKKNYAIIDRLKTVSQEGPTLALTIYAVVALALAIVLAFQIYQELDIRNRFIKTDSAAQIVSDLLSRVEIQDGDITIMRQSGDSPNGAAGDSAGTEAVLEPSNEASSPEDDAGIEGDTRAERPRTYSSANLESQIRERYSRFISKDTFGRQPGYFSTYETGPLSLMFLLALGALAGSCGALLSVLRPHLRELQGEEPISNLNEKEYHSHYLKIIIQPLLGAITCVIVGIVLISVASSNIDAADLLSGSPKFVSVPQTVFLVAFLFSIEPLRSLAAVMVFVGMQSSWLNASGSMQQMGARPRTTAHEPGRDAQAEPTDENKVVTGNNGG